MIKLIPLRYNSYNYGGTLQYYALKKAIEEQGKSCVVLDVDKVSTPIFSREHHRNVTISNFGKKAVAKLHRICLEQKTRNLKYSFENRNERFDEFRKQYVKGEYVDEVSERDINCDCELFISGSDQIWNPLWARNVHFFDFATGDAKTMVYGASIGQKALREDELQIYAKLLEKADYVSVRENEAKHIIEKALNYEVEVVVDPVFLLSKDHWEEMVPPEPITDEKYIFCYFLGAHKNEIEIAGKVSDRLGCKLVTIPYVTQQYNRYDEKYADVNCDDAGPLEFLGLIKNAAFIITDSFHAAAFSIIFHKEFYVLDRDPQDSRMLDRITTLLGETGLGHRLAGTAEEIGDGCIGWAETDEKLGALIKKSRTFISRGLS